MSNHEPPTDYAMALDSLRDALARIAELERERDEATTELSNWARRAGRAEQERDALRAENERLRWLLEVAVDYRDRPAGVSDEDWSRWKTESTTALGNAQEARE